MRLRDGRPVFLGAHVERLERSAQELRLPPCDGVVELALEAVDAAGSREGALRLFRTSATLLATVAPLPDGLETLRARGIAMITLRSQSGGLLTGVKATSYAAALAAVAEANRRGADDALYLGDGGLVLEATMANIWWREDDVLSTPALSTGVLPGVTRAAVARLAAEAGYRVRQGSFTLPLLLRADEAFTSSAVREIMPIVAIDGSELALGEAARRLQALLEAASGE